MGRDDDLFIYLRKTLINDGLIGFTGPHCLKRTTTLNGKCRDSTSDTKK